MKNTAQIKLLNEIGFAKTVLMPGDPLRAKMIAEAYLEDAVLINNVRGIQGYTGYYKGHKVSVMASGMGIPSMGIYSYELLITTISVAKEFGVELKIGNFYSTDSFYNWDIDANRKWADVGSIAVEMESAGLYLNAMRCKKRALAICTVSDMPLLSDCPGCTVEERENSFTDMIRIALEVAIRI